MALATHNIKALLLAAFLSAGPCKADRDTSRLPQRSVFSAPKLSQQEADRDPSIHARLSATPPADWHPAAQPVFEGIKEHIQSALAAHSSDISKSADEASRLAGDVASNIEQYHKDVKGVSNNMKDMDKVAEDLGGQYSALLDRGSAFRERVQTEQEQFVAQADEEAREQRDQGDAEDAREQGDAQDARDQGDAPILQDAQAEAAKELEDAEVEDSELTGPTDVVASEPETESEDDLGDETGFDADLESDAMVGTAESSSGEDPTELD